MSYAAEDELRAGRKEIQQNITGRPAHAHAYAHDLDFSHTASTTEQTLFGNSCNIMNIEDDNLADAKRDLQDPNHSRPDNHDLPDGTVLRTESDNQDETAEWDKEEVGVIPNKIDKPKKETRTVTGTPPAPFFGSAYRALLGQQYPYALRSIGAVAAAILLLILGCVLGGKASSIRTFWVVNVLSDVLFALALALQALATVWLYEAMLTARINHGVETPVYMTQGLRAMVLDKKGQTGFRGFQALAFLAGLITLAHLLADTGLDAEQIVVPKESNGLVWVAGDQCGAQEGMERMNDGPSGVFGAFARGELSEEHMPLALLAKDIYSGRIPDNGARVERVISSSQDLHVVFTAFFSESGNKPIMEMPQAIPVTKTEVSLWPAYGRTRKLYQGPAFEPRLEGVAMDPPKAKQLWSVVLASPENVGGWLRKYYSASIDDDTWEEQLIVGGGGFYTYQSKLVIFSSESTTTNKRLGHILFAVHEKADHWLSEDPGLEQQLASVEVPEGAWATHLITLSLILDCVGTTCTVESKNEVGAWSLVTEGDLSLASLWAIWRGLPVPSAETVGKGPTGVEDAARVVYAALYACGEVTTGPVGEYEVRAVISAQWFLAYIALLIYVVACVVMAARILRKEPFVPMPKTWYDGYQMASCDLGQAASTGSRYCAEPFMDAPANGHNDLLYNIIDTGPANPFDHLGLTKGPVIARARPLRGPNM